MILGNEEESQLPPEDPGWAILTEGAYLEDRISKNNSIIDKGIRTAQDIVFMSTAVRAGLISLTRHYDGDPNAQDLAIGAAVCDPTSGQVYGLGFAQDQETGNRLLHAEVAAMLDARQRGVGLGSLMLATTVEPCPSCLDEIDKAGIPRVLYGVSRFQLEQMGIVKPHGLDAQSIAEAGRKEGRYRFALDELTDTPATQALRRLCLRLLMGFERDLESGEVRQDPLAYERRKQLLGID